MSDSNLPGSELKWFSVSIRYFAPTIGLSCFISSFTLRAINKTDACMSARKIFREAFYDMVSDRYYLPGGILIQPWLIEAIELPLGHAMLLDEELRKLAPATPEVLPKGETEKTTNIVQLFPKNDGSGDKKP